MLTTNKMKFLKYLLFGFSIIFYSCNNINSKDSFSKVKGLSIEGLQDEFYKKEDSIKKCCMIYDEKIILDHHNVFRYKEIGEKLTLLAFVDDYQYGFLIGREDTNNFHKILSEGGDGNDFTSTNFQIVNDSTLLITEQTGVYESLESYNVKEKRIKKTILTISKNRITKKDL